MAEDKLSAKALKAQRRAEKVAAKGSEPGNVDASTNADRGNSQAAKLPQGSKANAQHNKVENKKPSTTNPQITKPAAKLPRTVALFSHLEQKTALTSEIVPRDIHHAIIAFALQCSSGQIIGSNTRCVAMLRAFQQVISEYTTPPNLQTSLQRHLPTYLSAQISYLVTARPLSISMGSAIRVLKQQISQTDIEASDEVNKERLINFIDTFIRERIEIAGQVIIKAAQERIVEGDVVLVYAHSTIVEAILLAASASVSFKVIVVDSRPKFEGRRMLKSLSEAGISCTYVMLTAVGYVMETVNKVFLGAHTVLANGAVYSRAGTALVAMTASEHHTPVIVACETYKFSDRVQLDSFVTNELGLTSEIDLDLQQDHLVEDSKAVKDTKAGKGHAKEGSGSKDTQTAKDAKPAAGKEAPVTKESQVLKLNLLYDVTPNKHITLCVSELGSLPTTAIPFAALSEQNYA